MAYGTHTSAGLPAQHVGSGWVHASVRGLPARRSAIQPKISTTSQAMPWVWLAPWHSISVRS